MCAAARPARPQTERCMRPGEHPGCARQQRASRQRQQGYTYLMLLTAVALVGVALAKLGPMWADEAQREREQELLRVGGLYASAILSYHQASPGSLKRYPAELSDLLLDTRFVGTRRHLRKLYPDPLDPQRSWGLVRAPDGGVAGVYSLDTRQPWRRSALVTAVLDLPAATRYADWKFIPRVDNAPGPTRTAQSPP
jgi:type II secretory pathway pseudopilin PulG